MIVPVVERTPSPARPAFIAALVELGLGIAVFVLFVGSMWIARKTSPIDAIFGRALGCP